MIVVTLAAVCLAQLALIAWLLRDWRGERAALLQRALAPHMAALEHHERGMPGPEDPAYAPRALIPDDDEAYWESRDELAARLMTEEVAEQNGRDR